MRAELATVTAATGASASTAGGPAAGPAAGGTPGEVSAGGGNTCELAGMAMADGGAPGTTMADGHVDGGAPGTTMADGHVDGGVPAAVLPEDVASSVQVAAEPAPEDTPDGEPCPLLEGGSVLVVDTYGVILGKHSERLRVRRQGQTIREAPLFRLRQVLVTSRGILLSSDALRECAERGVPLHLMSGRGELVASLASPVGNATAATRRHQLLAYLDDRGVHYGRCVVTGKLRNQATLLKYANKYRKGADQDTYRDVRDAAIEIEQLALDAGSLPGPDIDALRTRLLNLEGRGGHLYWQAIARLIAARLPDWPGRQHRDTQEPFNAALNYGYAVLGSQVHDALLAAGLDPAAGFLHTDRAGKRSLVYDLIEEFRQAAVDRALLAFVNRGGTLQMEDALLDRTSKQRVAEAVLARLASAEVYEGKRHSLRAIIWRQAQHLATFLRRERPAYAPFVARW